MRIFILLLLVLLTSLSTLPEVNAAEPAEASAAPVSYDLAEDGENRAIAAAGDLIGQPGPALTLKTIDGESIDLLQLYGNKPVYIKFWATWCVPCRQQMPGFEKIFQKYGDRIEVIAVNTGFNDSEKAIRRYKQKITMSMPIVIDDGRLGGLLNMRVTPMHVLIGRDGRIAYVGHKDGEKLHDALKKVMAAAPPSEVVTATPEKKPHFEKGDKVSGLSFTTLDGEKVALDGSANKPRALVFLAPWCESYLAKSRPSMAKACKRIREQVDAIIPDSDMEWYGISSNLWVKKKEVTDYKASTGTKLPLTYDAESRLFRAFSIRQIPSIVLIDRSGTVQKIIGPDTPSIEAAIQQISL